MHFILQLLENFSNHHQHQFDYFFFYPVSIPVHSMLENNHTRHIIYMYILRDIFCRELLQINIFLNLFPGSHTNPLCLRPFGDYNTKLGLPVPSITHGTLYFTAIISIIVLYFDKETRQSHKRRSRATLNQKDPLGLHL